MCGRAADEYADLEGLSLLQGIGVMYADVASDLVVHADFVILLIIITGHLYAVHSQIGSPDAGFLAVFGIDLGQKDEWSAIVGPTADLGELVDRGAMPEDGSGCDFFRQGVEAGEGEAGAMKWGFQERGGRGF